MGALATLKGSSRLECILYGISRALVDILENREISREGLREHRELSIHSEILERVLDAPAVFTEA